MDWGKPNTDWTALNFAASQVPISTQICSNNSKVAVAMIKHTKGFYAEEMTKYKHNGDLDFFCKMPKKHFQKHQPDMISYRHDPTVPTEMISLFTTSIQSSQSTR